MRREGGNLIGSAPTELSAVWEWLLRYWAPLSGIVGAVTAATMYIRKKLIERQIWKTLNELRTIQSNNPGLLVFEPRSLRELKLYETMVGKSLLFRGILPDHYQVRQKR